MTSPSPAPLDHAPSAADLLAEADRLAADGRSLEAVDLLHAANVAAPDPAVERRLAVLRHQAFDELDRTPGFPEWPVPTAGIDHGESPRIPVIAPSELNADAVRRAMAVHGSAHVPGLIDADTVRSSLTTVYQLWSPSTRAASMGDSPPSTSRLRAWWNT